MRAGLPLDDSPLRDSTNAITRLGSVILYGRSKMPSTKLKIAELAPMPNPRERIIVAATTGLRRKPLTASFKSRQRSSTHIRIPASRVSSRRRPVWPKAADALRRASASDMPPAIFSRIFSSMWNAISSAMRSAYWSRPSRLFHKRKIQLGITEHLADSCR